MKLIFLVLLVCFINNSKATNYYFSSSKGDDSRTNIQAQSANTPWKTLKKLNSFFSSLRPGDSVLFKRGDIFNDSIKVTQSGTAKSPIVLSAYGTGNKPVISGFANLSGWTLASSGIYTSAVNATTVNIVLVNGNIQSVGRYPNSNATNGGYLTINSHNKNSSVTCNALPSTPNFTGGKVIIRKRRWVLDKCTITNHSKTTLSYTGGSSWYNPTDGFGCFIQNHISTLDQLGEWYFNPGTKKLSVYFGKASPSSYVIRASYVTNLVTVSSRSYITFGNIVFQGANASGFNLAGSSNITINNCEVSYAVNGVYCYPGSANNVKVSNSIFKWLTDYGILLTNSSNNVIQNNILLNIGTIAGAGSSGDGGQKAIWVSGNNHVIQNNTIDTVGYTAIHFEKGNNIVIKNNYIHYFACTKDDGAAIYTYNGGSTSVYTGQKIQNNVVLNGIGAPLGTNAPTRSEAYGIYMDENSSGVEVTGNTVAYAYFGIINHNAHDIVYRNNTLFDNVAQAVWWHNATSNPVAVKGLIVKNNIFFSKTSSQDVVKFWDVTGTNSIPLFGTFDSNYYCRPIKEASDINVAYPSFNAIYLWYSLSGWQALYRKDAHSKKTFATVSDTSKIKFKYNAGSSSKTITLDKTYIGINGTKYSKSVTLAPYSSLILLDVSTAKTPVETISPPKEPQFTVKAQPNPSNSYFTLMIQSGDDKPIFLRVIDILGRVMETRANVVSNRILKIGEGYKSGVYFAEVMQGIQRVVMKLIKQSD